MRDYILDRIFVDPNTGCWFWALNTCPSGYGKGSVGGETLSMHRESYKEFVGPIPDGESVCHKCDTPLCVNPDHLFTSDQAGNMADMTAKGRRHTRPFLVSEESRSLAAELSCREFMEKFGVSRATYYRYLKNIS